MSNPLVFGKDALERVVSLEVKEGDLEIFIEEKDGTVRSELMDNYYWLLAPKSLSTGWVRLKGDLYYKYAKTYRDKHEFLADKARFKKADVYAIYDAKEAAMVVTGLTYFKGTKVNEVSTLAFDIESTGLEHDADSKVLLISNTFRKNGVVTRKLFSYSDYEEEQGLFIAWSEWVQEMNPSMLIGHNIYSYDLPYMAYCAEKAGTELRLGRDGSAISFDDFESKFRKDGSQFYTFHRAHVYGREIVDTLFLSIRYDFSRKYANYKLKYIVAAEGLEIAGRQHYDAANIASCYKDPVEWEKIKLYALHDADDALALYDLMVPAYFYLTQSVPKPFQAILTSASGSQINSLLMRSYLQGDHSVPKANEASHFEGAISFGHPGVFHNVFKVDVASLYPSIMLQYRVYDRYKDPRQNFLKMVEYFTAERLENKRRAKETGDRYYKDLEQAQKIVINSAYGMMGAPGLNFNSPANAAFVTRKGREILQTAIDWAPPAGFFVVNADTDSISICRVDQSDIPADEQKSILERINKLFPEKIHFEDDGYYPGFLVIKAKNYVLFDGKKYKTKGSALKATNKERALVEFIDKTVQNLLHDKRDAILTDYREYVKEIHNLKDITRWSSKKTITQKVLDPKRTNEQKVFDIVEDSEYKLGDKIYVYFDVNEALKLQEEFAGDHHVDKLLEKLFKTLEIFETVLDVKQFPNFKLKRNKKLLDFIAA